LAQVVRRSLLVREGVQIPNPHISYMLSTTRTDATLKCGAWRKAAEMRLLFTRDIQWVLSEYNEDLIFCVFNELKYHG